MPEGDFGLRGIRVKIPTQSVRYITDDEARWIYYNWYWDKIYGDKLVYPLEVTMFDTYVQFQSDGIKFLQRLLGV